MKAEAGKGGVRQGGVPRVPLDQTAPDVVAARTLGHHLEIGPGEALTSEWLAAGLSLPDLDAMRHYRLDRIIDQLVERNYDGVILMDPMNIRYATDTTNMQVWVMHNGARYAWVGADRRVIVWEFVDCEFLSDYHPLVTEVRPAIGSTYFLAGHRFAEKARQWADEMITIINETATGSPRVAIDQCHYLGYRHLEEAGVEIGFGGEVMEQARLIKGPDELAAMRCAVHACQASMAEMREAAQPGMTERDVWALLHAGNIRRAGEWIETQILASGPRTNPWMQEASSRIIEAGDLVAFDTDLVGAYGMMVDISRTWLVGADSPDPAQAHVHALAQEQIDRNIELLTPGRSLEDISRKSWFPADDDYRHYCVLNHGVGQCDEYPEVVFPEVWDEWGVDDELRPGMVLTTEAFVGSRSGGPGVKLEEQVLITESGPERLSSFPMSL